MKPRIRFDLPLDCWVIDYAGETHWPFHSLSDAMRAIRGEEPEGPFGQVFDPPAYTIQ